MSRRKMIKMRTSLWEQSVMSPHSDLRAHAVIVGTAALLNARIAAMEAENIHRIYQNVAVAYDEGTFQDETDKYKNILGYNSILSMFKE